MRCPYLSDATKKVCVKMLEAQISGDLNDFDLRHFCDGNPIYCYYFRLPQLQNQTRPERKISPSLMPTAEKSNVISIKDLLFKRDEKP